jgi:hypothetical protein
MQFHNILLVLGKPAKRMMLARRTEVCAAPCVFLKILTIVFRYGAQHDLDQHARCRSTATDIWKLALTARPPTWPGLGANMSQRDPDAPTDAEVSALPRRKGVSPACASPMAAFAHVARRAEHIPAAHDVFFVPLRGGRGGQLGENWARPPAFGQAESGRVPGALAAASSGWTIKNGCTRCNRRRERRADKAPRRSHDFDAAGRECRLGFLN